MAQSDGPSAENDEKVNLRVPKEFLVDPEPQQRVLDKVDETVRNDFRDPPDFTKPLTGAKSWESRRIGESRAIVRFDRDRRLMQVGSIGRRSSISDAIP